MTCKKLLTGVLALLLTGCSTVKYVRELPPQELLGDCKVVSEKTKTNGELVYTILAYRESLALCNIDKDSLRKWAEQE